MNRLREIKIVSRYNSSKVLLCGEYESVKDCLEKNKLADLSGANLSRADLSRAELSRANLYGANLSVANLYGANLSEAELSRADLSGADLSGADLSEANLYGADLSGANLSRASLYGANLSVANLSGAKGYLNSHDFFQEIIKRQDSKTFTSKEWSCIGQIIVYRLCWDSMEKRFKKEAMSVFKKLSRIGFNEWEKEFKKRIKK